MWHDPEKYTLTSGGVIAVDIEVSQFFDQRQLNNREGIHTPNELWDYLIKTEDHEKFRMPKGEIFYRGQSNSDHGLNSTLYRLIAGRRRYSKTPSAFKHDAEAAMREAEDKVIAIARENGLGMGLTDLELLALLQHHGMPTRLIDVTRSPLTALYFAVEKEDEKNARLFIISAKDKLTQNVSKNSISVHSPEDTRLPWISSKPTTATWRQTVYEAAMSPLDARMIAQRASFLVGGIYTSGGKLQQYFYDDAGKSKIIDVDTLREISTLIICFLKKDLAPKKATTWGSYGWTILIPAEWKPELRRRLAEHRPQIHFDSIYPPINEVKRLVSHVAATTLNRK